MEPPELKLRSQESQHAPDTFISRMIMSASGWRGIFAPDGDPEGHGQDITEEAREFCMRTMHAFIRYLTTLAHEGRPLRILIAQDSRPTGKAIRSFLVEAAQACGTVVDDAGIRCVPEVLAGSKAINSFPRSNHRSLGFTSPPLRLPVGDARVVRGYASHPVYDGVVYITASHNPIGYNGFKFARNGAVISRDQEQKLRTLFHENLPAGPVPPVSSREEDENAQGNTEGKGIDANYYNSSNSDIIRDAYEAQLLTCASHSALPKVHEAFLQGLRHEMKKNPLGIVIDMNGSSRISSLDKDLLSRAGADVHVINGTLGDIVHGIIPEGQNMEACRRTLEELHRRDTRWQLGYMPDCDGDRGNIAYVCPDGTAGILTSQEMFALVVLSELATPVPANRPQAVAVNCATSLRIDRLCTLFGARLARAEVGEANVTTLAGILQEEGYHVRIMGEGSNGGNIIPPSFVRDPLTAIFSILRFIRTKGEYSPATAYAGRTGITLSPTPTVYDVLKSLPDFFSTGSTDPEATVHAHITDYDAFKTAYEKAFLASWPVHMRGLAGTGISLWREEQTEGPRLHIGMGTEFRAAPYTGGLKIVFMDKKGRDQAFMWMRPSATEPVFRLAVDCSAEAGGLHTYSQLMKWHRQLIMTALSGQSENSGGDGQPPASPADRLTD